MSDGGKNSTDKALKKLEKKIKSVYGEAADDIQKKIDDFYKKYIVKNNILLEKVDKGEITEEEYNKWYAGQVFQGKQWKLKKYDIEHVLENSNEIAVNMINNESIHVFSANCNYQEYDLDSTHSVDFGFELYDSATVSNLLKKDPKLLPEWKINEPKDYVWNGKKIDRQVALGIIEGESLDKIAKRIATNLTSQNMNKMKMFARTAMTSAQNAGRYQGLSNAKDIGLEVVKEWMATLDLHTRDTHRHMDGEQQKVGDKWHPFKFSNGCRFPGDPEGPPREVYNCRCTLVGDLINFPSEYKRYDNIDGKPIENMSYDDWYNAKQSQKKHLAEVAKAEAELKKLGKIEDVEKEVSDLEQIIQGMDGYKTFSGIWMDVVTYADWEEKKGSGSIEAKKQYFKSQLDLYEMKFLEKSGGPISDKDPKELDKFFNLLERSEGELSKAWNLKTESYLQSLGFDVSTFANTWQDFWLGFNGGMIRKKIMHLKDLDTFDFNGEILAPYFKRLKEAKEKLQHMLDLQAIISGKANTTGAGIFGPDAYSKERKDNALWTTDQQKVDDILRPPTGKVWQNATDLERESIYKYTHTYHMFNEPLRGYEYGTQRFLGVGGTDLDAGSEHNGKNLNAMTDIIDKSRLPQDQWFQRGTSTSGAAKFLGIDYNLLENGTEEELKNALLGTTPTEYGFMSMGSSKGMGFLKPVIFYVYAPKGTKAMYVEPFSRYGGGAHLQWDGKSKQSYFGDEFETILQQGTQFRVTRVRRKRDGVHIDIEVIGQGSVQRWKK